MALQAIIVTYDGWYSAIYFTEEDRDPARNLPRSALGGALATIVIYLLVNLALLHVLTVSEIAGSTLPAAAAASTAVPRSGLPLDDGGGARGVAAFSRGQWGEHPENTLYAVSLIALSYPLYGLLRSRRPPEIQPESREI